MRSIFCLISVLIFLSCDRNSEEIAPIDDDRISFEEGVINDEVNGVPIVIFADEGMKFLSAFRRTDVFGKQHTFERSDQGFPNVFRDEDGEVWNVFGTNVENTDIGLEWVDFLVGYWFVFPPFHKQLQFYDGTVITNASFEAKSSDWSINSDFIFAGSVKDGIQSIDQPKFHNAGSKEFLQNEFYNDLDGNQLLTAIEVDDITHVYPQRILEYHEVVNDMIGEHPVTISYCPLTGTSRAWSRVIGGNTVEFGVSGLLFNSNLILYDRLTDSFWSQIFGKSVNGALLGQEVSTFNVFEIRLEDLAALSGRVKILSTETGISYDYRIPIYSIYPTSDRVSFPLSFSDDRFHSKERVIGVTVGELTKVYRFSDFKK